MGTPLARRLGPLDATAVGLGSMLGAGVFAVFAPAAASAGGWLPVAVVIAGFVAYCNAVASAQLAAAYPTSGGTYTYGRERLGDWWGFTAGWGFVVGKTASCAAMALTFGTYVAPDFARPVAVAAVLVLTAVNHVGVTRTALLTKVLLAIVLSVLLLVITLSTVDATGTAAGWPLGDAGPFDVLQAAGLLFFAFAGFARIATMGEEVREPARTIPRAILSALGIALVLYLVLAVLLLNARGPDRLAEATRPIVDLVAGRPVLTVVVTVGAAAASLGALLALIAGVSRTALAMARNRDLPERLAAVHPTYRVPHHAGVAVAVVVCAVVLVADLREVIGFSSFGVLVYYAIANLSAFTQPVSARRWPRALNVIGCAACVVLVVTLPLTSVLVGLAVFAVGLVGRAVTAWWSRC